MKARNERQKELHRVANSNYRLRHPARLKASRKQWRNNNPDYFKNKNKNHPEWQRTTDLLKRYGLRWEDKVNLYKSQNGLCALCNQPLSGPENRDTQVDHKPGTKSYRSLVHNKCNQLIRVIETSGHLIDAAKEYLRAHN